MRIRLADDDRQRLGAPEVLDIDLSRLMLSEARVIKKATGLRPLEMLTGLGLLDPDAWAAAVWLGLCRAGVDAPAIEDLDIDLRGGEAVDDPKETTETTTPTSTA